jgi:hypothetical protein
MYRTNPSIQLIPYTSSCIMHHSFQRDNSLLSLRPSSNPTPFCWSSILLPSREISFERHHSADLKSSQRTGTPIRSPTQSSETGPRAADVLGTLRDPTKVPWFDITNAIEHLESYGTFRGCLSDDWIITSPGPMERQRNGTSSRALQARGVRFVVAGDLTEEWYIYSIAHPIDGAEDIVTNLERYFSSLLVRGLMKECYPPMRRRKN